MDFFSYEYPGMGQHLIRMMTSGVVSWAIIFLIEFLRLKNLDWRKFCKIGTRNKDFNNNNTEETNIDNDVLEEKRLVKRLKDKELAQYNLVIKELRKCYGKYTAVKDMSVAVNK